MCCTVRQIYKDKNNDMIKSIHFIFTTQTVVAIGETDGKSLKTSATKDKQYLSAPISSLILIFKVSVIHF